MNLDELLPDDAIIDFHAYVDAYDDGLPTGAKRRHESHITGKDLKAALRESMEYIVDSRIRDLVNCGSIKV